MTTDRSIETIDATTTNRVPPSTPTDQGTNDDDDDDDDEASSHALTPIDPSIHPSIDRFRDDVLKSERVVGGTVGDS